MTEKTPAAIPPDDYPAEEVLDPLTDGDPDHFDLASAHSSEVPVVLRQGLFLYRYLLDLARRPWEETRSNDLSASACFTRAYRAVRGATLLCVFGYYDEVPTVLREAYESAAMARYLARQPEIADKWLNTGDWIPDKRVRDWFGDTDRIYAERYSGLSKRSHPTAAACLQLLDPDEEGYALRFGSRFDKARFEDSLHEILATMIWVIFALKNAVVDEDLLPPEWREGAVEWAKSAGEVLSAYTGVAITFDHLDHDWDKIRADYEKLVSKVLDAEQLAEVLAEHPYSAEALRKLKDTQEG